MQNLVEACDVGVQFRLPVVVFDLGCERVPAQPEAFDEAAGDGLPVHCWCGGEVCRIGSGGAVDFAEVFGVLDAAQLAGEAVGEDRDLLAEGGRGGWLAVGAREHRRFSVSFCHLGQLVHQVPRGWQPDVLDRVADAERVGEVVDVF